MPKKGDRIELICQSVLDRAHRMAKKTLREATEHRGEELARYARQLDEEFEASVRQAERDSKQAMREEVSREEKKSTRRLLLRRMELTEAVFDEARQKLLEYAATPEYRTALLQELSRFSTDFDHAATTVLVREADMALAGDVARLLPGCTVAADAANKLGGFALENTAARTRVDETLEDRLNRQRTEFLQTCGLKIK